MKWIQYRLSTSVEAVDSICYNLSEIGIEGVEIEDNIPLSEEDKKQMYVDLLDETFDEKNNEVIVKFYLSEEHPNDEIIDRIKLMLGEIKQYLPIGKGTITSLVRDENEWADNWKKYFKSFKVDNNIIIKPTWEQLKHCDEGDIVIELDPGMAFGTGTHETTSLCIKKINKYIENKNKLYDIGCGSGILGIVAAKLGAKEVVCIDIDPNAVKVAKENVEANKVDAVVQVFQGNLADTLKGSADIIVANILAEVIIALSEDIVKFLKPDGYFISSGIIVSKVKDVVTALEKQHLNIIEIEEKGDWAVIVSKIMGC